MKPDLVTLTVGANDIQFGDCFQAIFLKTGTNPCNGSTFQTDLKALGKNLSVLLTKIKALFPGTPIYMMKYYNPLPTPPTSTAELCPASAVMASLGIVE